MKKRQTKIIVALIGFLILVILLPNSPMFRQSLGEDGGMFLYHGRKILQGFIPYRDTWEHKGPIILYINALGLMIGNGSRWGVWFLEFFSLYTAALICFVLLKKALGIIPSIFATLFWIVSVPLVLDGGGNIPEEYNLLFQFVAIYLFWQSKFQYLFWWRGFFIGILGAFSFFMKPNLIGIQIAIIFFIFIKGFREKQFAKAIKDVIAIGSGFFLITFIIVSYFKANNVFVPFIDSFYHFNKVYASTDLLSQIKSFFMGMWILARSGLTFVALTSWVLGIMYYRMIYKNKDKRAITSLLLVVLIGFPIELFLASISGKSPPHYYMPWFPVFTLLAGFFAYLCIEYAKNKQMVSWFLMTFLFVASVLPFGVLFYEYRPDPNLQICKDIGWFLLPSSNYFECTDTKIKVSEYVQQHTNSSDYVLVWGFGGSINYMANRLSPTRFTYQYPLFIPAYQTAEMAEELYKDIVIKRPVLIVDTTVTQPRVPSLDKQDRKKWTGGVILPQMERLFTYVSSHYKLVSIIGQDQWRIYRYFDQSGNSIL